MKKQVTGRFSCILALSLLSLLLILSAGMPAGAEKLMPVDESDKAPGFPAFKKKLLTALDKKDKAFIYSIVYSRGQFSFGPEKPGLPGFKQMYHLDDPGETFWSEMKKVLLLGGTVSDKGNEMIFPYVHSQFPSGYGGYDYTVAINQNVPVREKPSEKAKVVATLSYDIVEKIYDADWQWQPWVKVKTPDGRTGFVRPESLYSPIDMRAFFSKIGRKWMLTAFLGGD